MMNTMRILHSIELVLILALAIITSIEGCYIFHLSKKEPSTALVVVEDTSNLTEISEVPEIQITEK